MPNDTIDQAEQFSLEQKAAGNVAASRDMDTAIGGNMVQQVGKLGQQYLDARKTEMTRRQLNSEVSNMKQVMSKQRTNFDEGLRLENKLSKIDKAASDRMLYEEKKFKLDKFGRKMLNETQLIDWMNTKARSEEEWKSFSDRSEDLHQKKIVLMEAVYNRLTQAEKNLYKKFGQDLDLGTREKIARKKQAVEREIEQSKRNAKNKAAIISGVATIASVAAMAAI